MQLKMGGELHLKLNTGERPIVNKYREGKMKSTLEREWNSTWNCWKGNAWSQSCWPRLSLALAWCNSWLTGQHQFCLLNNGKGNVTPLWCVIVSCRMQGLRLRNSARTFRCRGFAHDTCLGCWHNGFKRPVLKHGPRSLTYLRVFGWKTRARNESESWDLCREGHRRPDQTFCDGSAVKHVC